MLNGLYYSRQALNEVVKNSAHDTRPTIAAIKTVAYNLDKLADIGENTIPNYLRKYLNNALRSVTGLLAEQTDQTVSNYRIPFDIQVHVVYTPKTNRFTLWGYHNGEWVETSHYTGDRTFAGHMAQAATRMLLEDWSGLKDDA